MASLIRAPKTSENTEELTVGKWYVKVGDTVAADAPLCQLITDKAAFDMPCEKCAGVVLVRSAATVGSVIPVGHILVAVGLAEEAVAPLEGQLAGENAALDAARTGRAAAADSTAAAVRATPKARRLAKEKNVNLAAVKVKLAIDGAITPEDIERFLAEGGA